MNSLITEPLFWTALISLLTVTAVTVELSLGLKGMTDINGVPVPAAGRQPGVSIIVPARNEAAAVEPALRSMLSLAYDDYEVIAVDDRSTDATGAILREMADRYPRLRVHRIDELPAGWLGKTHALQYGAQRAKGEYLLFTDADIIMEPTVLARAIRHMTGDHLDHLSLLFRNTAPGGLLNALLVDIGGGLLLLFKPWKAKDPQSPFFMGVGAFNLVRSSVYRRIGMHRRLAMHPIDDVMLGRLIKEHGFAQDCLLGGDLVSVKWYGTVGQLIQGLMKNVFAAYGYRAGRLLAGVVFIFVVGILPVWGLVFGPGIVRLLFGAAVLIRQTSFIQGLKTAGLPSRLAVWSLATPYINIYISLKAMYGTLSRQGITWRSTFYPLAELKKYVDRP